MKAFVTSIGERTTKLCCLQLERLGFVVELLDEKQPWGDKYNVFIKLAQGDCLRVDADVIVNRVLYDFIYKFELDEFYKEYPYWMTQFKTYDLYKNQISITSPVYYSWKALDVIKRNIDNLDLRRPETSAW